MSCIMAKIRTISPIEAMSGKLSKLDDVYFRTNTFNGDVTAVKQRHFALQDNAKQATQAQKAHQEVFRETWKKVDVLLSQSERQIYEALYELHIKACRNKRPLNSESAAVAAFKNAPGVIPEGVNRSATEIIEDLKKIRKPYASLRNFVFHCIGRKG